MLTLCATVSTQIGTQCGGTSLNFCRRFQNPVGDAPCLLGRFPPSAPRTLSPVAPRPGAGNYASRHAARGAPRHVRGEGGAGAGCCRAGGAVSARLRCRPYRAPPPSGRSGGAVLRTPRRSCSRSVARRVPSVPGPAARGWWWA